MSGKIIPLARRCPPPPSPSVARSRCGNDRALTFRASMQTGTNPSLGLFATAFEGLCGEENAPHSFTSRAALKLAKFFNAMIEIAKSFTFFLICLFGGLVITGAVLSPFIYWKFFALH